MSPGLKGPSLCNSQLHESSCMSLLGPLRKYLQDITSTCTQKASAAALLSVLMGWVDIFVFLAPSSWIQRTKATDYASRQKLRDEASETSDPARSRDSTLRKAGQVVAACFLQIFVKLDGTGKLRSAPRGCRSWRR